MKTNDGFALEELVKDAIRFIKEKEGELEIEVRFYATKRAELERKLREINRHKA